MPVDRKLLMTERLLAQGLFENLNFRETNGVEVH
mgnify:CR=1 FL=1